MAVIQTAVPKERDPGPYAAERRCPKCLAYLSRYQPGPRCQPCQLSAMPESERMDEAA